MLIPHDLLASATLRVLIEEFVTRDGTDYGATEIPLELRVQRVMSQLQQGLVVISYDAQTQSCTIIPKEQ